MISKIICRSKKNASLIVFNVGLLAALCSCDIIDIRLNCCLLYLGASIILIGLAVSMVLSLLSFLPKLGTDTSGHKKSYNTDDNLMFFENIQYYDSECYLAAIYKQYFPSIKPRHSFSVKHMDIAREMAYNSMITSWNYRLFKCALIIDIVLVGLLVLVVLVMTIQGLTTQFLTS